MKNGGERTEELRFFDLESNLAFPDHLQSGLCHGFAFSPDGSGFFYCRETQDAKKNPHQIRYHRFGNCADADETIFEAKRTFRSRLFLISDTVHLGALYSHEIDSHIVIDFHVTSPNKPQQWQPVFIDHQVPYQPFFWDSRLYVLSFTDFMNGAILKLNDDGSEGRIIIPSTDKAIQNIRVAGDRIYLTLRDGLTSEIQCWNQQGEHLETLPVFPDGTVSLLRASAENSKALFFTYESFGQPRSIYEYSESTQSYVPWWTPPLDTMATLTNRVSYNSKDVVQIPLWLVMRRDTHPDKDTPAILTGYGAAGISMTPRFSVLVAIMMELGAVFALPNIRGGSEFGDEWHESARGRKHQVAFDDFIAAAEWLCKNKITSPKRLAIFGGSFSGLLVGAAMTQRPELFGAVLCLAPILDMVRYEQFGDARKWIPEYGTVDDRDDFSALFAYSPYHQVRDNQNYPPCLFVSGDRDGQCDPAHTRKMAARLLDRVAQLNPIVVDYSTERGHSAVLPLSVRIDALTRRITFLCRELRIVLPKEEIV